MSRNNFSPGSFLDGDKQRLKGAGTTCENDFLHGGTIEFASSFASTGQQFSYVCGDELEGLIHEGRCVDVRESLPANTLQKDAAHLLPPEGVDTIHRMLDIFLRGFAVLAAELTAKAADQPATLAKIWITFCRSAEAQFASTYKSEIYDSLQRDRIILAKKLAEARELSQEVHKHEQGKAIVEQRLERVLAEQRQLMENAAASRLEADTWRIKAEEAERERDKMVPELQSARSRIDSLEEALQGLSKLVEVSSDKDEVRDELEAEYGAELQRLQALISAAQQEATNAMARERESLAAEEQTRREKRRAQADVSELRDSLEQLQQKFNELQVAMVEERARAEATLSSVKRDLSVERVAREVAQRDAAHTQVEITQERQRTKAALQAEADQLARTRESALKLSELECDLANERARIRLVEAGRQTAEDAADVLRRQLEGSRKSLLLYRAAAGESASKGEKESLQIASLQQELSEASALIQVLGAENDKLKGETAEMRDRLVMSQEGDTDHAREVAIITSEMDVLHGKLREVQHNAAAVTSELASSKKHLTESLDSLRKAKENVAKIEADLEAETKMRVRVEDDLGAANAQVTDLLRLVRELKATQKDQGGLSDDLIDARVALSAAREEVDKLRLQLSGYEQEARSSMKGSLKAQKDLNSQLDTAMDELSSLFKLGKKVIHGSEPDESPPVKSGIAMEAVQEAVDKLESQNEQSLNTIMALEEDIKARDEQAKDALAAVTAEKEEADRRANEVELNAIREMEIMQEMVNQLEGRVNRLRVALVENTTFIQATLQEVGIQATVQDDGTNQYVQATLQDDETKQSSPSSHDLGNVKDKDLISSLKEQVDVSFGMLDQVSKEKETYAAQCAELTATTSEAKTNIANLEAELRAFGEASEKESRDRENAENELKVAKEALSEIEGRLATAEARAQSAETQLKIATTKTLRTLGTQAGPGLSEPAAKHVKTNEEKKEKKALEQTLMDDRVVPEKVDEIIPREPPPPPRILKPVGWGSTWAKSPRTRPDPPLHSTLKREGMTDRRTPVKHHEASLRSSDTAADRLGIHDYFNLTSSLQNETEDTNSLGEDHTYLFTHRAQAVSAHNPQPRSSTIVKADSRHIKSSSLDNRPQTSPAFSEGFRAHQTSMHASAARRQELPMGRTQLGTEGSAIHPDFKHRTMVPARLGALMKSRQP